MNKNEPYKIDLNLISGKLTNEIYKFFSVSLDTSKYTLSEEQKSKIVEKMRKENSIPDSNKKINELLLLAIDAKIPDVPSSLMFYGNISKLKQNLVLSITYVNQPLGDNLLAFLNLDFNKFDDFFKFFCTFIFMYADRIPKEHFKKIFKDLSMNTVYLDDIKHTVDISILKESAKLLYKEEKIYLIEMQELYRDFVDYIFNNNKESKLNKLTTKQRFFVFEHITEEIKGLSKDYICDYNLGFNFQDKNFIDNIKEKVLEGDTNPMSNEEFLISSLIKDDPDGTKMNSSKYSFKTNSIFTYFYIVLYHITCENNEFIKKCQVCGRYFFSNKESTLYCNRKYSDDMTCKEFGIRTSQKRKENEEPVYGKYRQIYAKKAMTLKRNPDIDSYKTSYEKWKKEAKTFINDIKAGKRSYEEFDEWLNKK